MPEYLAPGVYVEEVDTGPKPIEGVSTSTAAMLGVTQRGPLNTPILITSLGDFTRWFGGTLDIRKFRNKFGAHCYLPYAIQGFFANGGKRVYITRVLDTSGARRAAINLFDRGDAKSADTVLLRAVNEQTGTAANSPLIYLLDVSEINVSATDPSKNDWIRIGNGSNADYRQVASVGNANENTHVSLCFPLSFYHEVEAGDNIFQFKRKDNNLYPKGFTLAKATRAADTTVVVNGDKSEIDKLNNDVNTAGIETLLEIDGVFGEYHFAKQVKVLAAKQASVRLRSTLAMPHKPTATVKPIDLPATPVEKAKLAVAARGGSSLIFVDDRKSKFKTRTDLVAIGSATDTAREVRRIGDISRLKVAAGAYEVYKPGSLVEAVKLADDDRTLTVNAAAGAKTIAVDDPTALAVGDSMIVGANVAASAEKRIIKAVDATKKHITFTKALTNLHNKDEVLRPAAKKTAKAASDGDRVIAVDNRLGLSTDDVIRVGIAPNDEYLTIDELPSATGIAPDRGNLILKQTMAQKHAAGTEIRRQAPPLAANLQPSVLALEQTSGKRVLVVTDGDGHKKNSLIRVTTPTPEVFYHRLTADAESSLGGKFTPAEVTLSVAVSRPHPDGSDVVSRKSLFRVQGIDAGAWGNRLRISVKDEDTGLVPETTVKGAVNPTTIRLSSLTGVESGTLLELMKPTDDTVIGNPVKVVSVDRSEGTASLAAALSSNQQSELALQRSLKARSREFSLSVFLLRQPDAALPTRNDTVIDSEVFRHLSLDPQHPRYIETVIGDIDGAPRLSDRRPEGESSYIRVSDPASASTARKTLRVGPEALTDTLPDGRKRAARQALVDGDDSIGTLRDKIYIGSDSREPAERTGLYTFKNQDDISLVACPGRTSARMQGALITHCENMRYRFAVLDAELPPRDSLNDVQAQRQRYDSKYAALYHPWLLIPDPDPTNLAQVGEVWIPPSGHMLGIYARTDIERGVHKAPANAVVRGITGLRRVLNKGEHDILNPVNINVIRDFRRDNRGIRVWGGRVITSDTAWKYVNVRRLLIFIEASIDRGVQWVVFEPNAEPLWARVRRAVSNFLTTVWRNGALEGTKTEEAFFVKCDRTTMTQTDIDNGRLICVIGVAPVKPAEFVIIRIGLWTANGSE